MVGRHRADVRLNGAYGRPDGFRGGLSRHHRRWWSGFATAQNEGDTEGEGGTNQFHGSQGSGFSAAKLTARH